MEQKTVEQGLQLLDKNTVVAIASISATLTFGIMIFLFRSLTKGLKKILNRLDIFEMKLDVIDSWLYKKDNSEYKNFRDSEMEWALKADRKINSVE